ncbi:General transcription factor IIH subunit 1 [Thelohanellus kitauei]|uniref:General transcription factor IIH subunit 1 n=1 Tax=Thelohanellus kitauei TaxID=669202 RepID=A0A0C2NGX8_THEKT|nr:General transcription factor IIH subunit 1 [Thelohanellus kitauei]KII73252.1 General transcription factor IIH subunit 1 [Thelohanellus kitauei]
MAVSKSTSSAFSISQKNELLSNDPKLFNLYRELVMSGCISSNEFWSSPIILKNKMPVSQITAEQSKVPIPNAFWSSLVPVSIGCNEINLKLTTESVDAIFLAYPLGMFGFVS